MIRSALFVAWAVAAAGLLVGGCAHQEKLDAELADPLQSADTAELAALRDRNAQPLVNATEAPQDVATIERGTVQHHPTYFNDPYVDRGGQDGQFGFGRQDVGYLAYGPTRYAINLMFLPVSVAVDPPWELEYSDGRVGTRPFEDHDVNADYRATAGGAPMHPQLVPPGTIEPRTEAADVMPLASIDPSQRTYGVPQEDVPDTIEALKGRYVEPAPLSERRSRPRRAPTTRPLPDLPALPDLPVLPDLPDLPTFDDDEPMDLPTAPADDDAE